jgi:hypothetical protein
MEAIRVYPDFCQSAEAARFIGAKVATLHKAAMDLGPGIRLTGKGGRTATYIGKHPDPDYLGSWWRIAEPAAQEVAQ